MEAVLTTGVEATQSELHGSKGDMEAEAAQHARGESHALATEKVIETETEAETEEAMEASLRASMKRLKTDLAAARAMTSEEVGEPRIEGQKRAILSSPPAQYYLHPRCFLAAVCRVQGVVLSSMLLQAGIMLAGGWME